MSIVILTIDCCGCVEYRLSVVTNEISGQGLCDIADSLRKKNHSVTELFIWGNDLQVSCCIVSLHHSTTVSDIV